MKKSTNRTAVLIAGPTASGKSAVALKVARELDGVIINADAMQLYAELRVLTSPLWHGPGA
jgi:tRNA dimethylallyltransferase